MTATETLLKELKQLDDKIILTEVYLLESRAAHAIQNLPRAKVRHTLWGYDLMQSAQTSARTTANSIYCPPILQAQLDLQSGAINADEKDYKTAYSYFFEAFEGFAQYNEKDPRALRALKYMLLCKIMMGLVGVVYSTELMSAGRCCAITPAQVCSTSCRERFGRDASYCKSFEGAESGYVQGGSERVSRAYVDIPPQPVAVPVLMSELQQDPLIRSHLSILYDTLLEQNLVRVIEPYSAVELSWIASEVGQSVQVVEEKLSQMILDQVFFGVLNENVGTLEVYDEPVEDVSACRGICGR